MYGCESWTIKKAECWIIDAFKLWCWRRLLRVPWTSKKSYHHSKGNQPWVFIGRTLTETEDLILWPHDAKSQLMELSWCWERLKAAEKRGQRTGWLDGIIDSMDMKLSRPWEIVKDREFLAVAVHGVAMIWIQLSNWKTTRHIRIKLPKIKEKEIVLRTVSGNR